MCLAGRIWHESLPYLYPFGDCHVFYDEGLNFKLEDLLVRLIGFGLQVEM